MVGRFGRWLSFWDGLFSGAMLVVGECLFLFEVYEVLQLGLGVHAGSSLDLRNGRFASEAGEEWSYQSSLGFWTARLLTPGMEMTKWRHFEFITGIRWREDVGSQHHHALASNLFRGGIEAFWRMRVSYRGLLFGFCFPMTNGKD